MKLSGRLYVCMRRVWSGGGGALLVRRVSRPNDWGSAESIGNGRAVFSHFSSRFSIGFMCRSRWPKHASLVCVSSLQSVSRVGGAAAAVCRRRRRSSGSRYGLKGIVRRQLLVGGCLAGSMFQHGGGVGEGNPLRDEPRRHRERWSEHSGNSTALLADAL
jgi:hypothetical protein